MFHDIIVLEIKDRRLDMLQSIKKMISGEVIELNQLKKL